MHSKHLKGSMAMDITLNLSKGMEPNLSGYQVFTNQEGEMHKHVDIEQNLRRLNRLKISLKQGILFQGTF